MLKHGFATALFSRSLPLVLSCAATALTFTSAHASAASALGLEPCADAKQFPALATSLCGSINSPLNAQEQDGVQIKLFVREFPAKESKGSVWLIAGGPGEAGNSLYPLVSVFQQAFPGYDLIIPDHRGTGNSSRVCPEQESPNSEAGTSLAGAEWGACFGQMFGSMNYTQAFSISNAAADLNQLLQQSQDSKPKFLYGVSYGTQLVLRSLSTMSYAQQKTIDGVILDSLVPAQDDAEFDLSQRSHLNQSVGLAALEKLAPEDFPKLKAQLRDLRATNEQEGFKNKLTVADTRLLFSALLDLPTERKKLPSLIRAAHEGDTATLEAAYQQAAKFYQEYLDGYPGATNSIPLVQIISASENNLRPKISKEDIASEEQGLDFRSPLPGLLAGNQMPTYARDDAFAQTPQQLPRTLILQGSLDPKTSWLGAKRHSEKLAGNGEVQFQTITDAPHFIALFAQQCFRQLSNDFLKAKAASKTQCDDPATVIQ